MAAFAALRQVLLLLVAMGPEQAAPLSSLSNGPHVVSPAAGRSEGWPLVTDPRYVPTSKQRHVQIISDFTEPRDEQQAACVPLPAYM